MLFPFKTLSCVLIAIAVVLSMGLGGCTPWPVAANGGLAERHPTASVLLLTLESRYDAAAKAGATRFLPGRLAEVELLIIRAKREHEGGLLEDSTVTAAKADLVLSAIERDLGSRPTPSRRQSKV
jgi:hypothetical protein